MCEGDIVLIQYSSKSKAGDYRLGRVVSVEIDPDSMVRTVTVKYSLIQHLPEKERSSYKGVTVKYIRVAVQRLVLIVPVEEQEDFQGISEEDIKKVNSLSSQKVKITSTSSKSNSFMAVRLKQRAREQIDRSVTYFLDLKKQLEDVDFDESKVNHGLRDILERPYVFKTEMIEEVKS